MTRASIFINLKREQKHINRDNYAWLSGSIRMSGNMDCTHSHY